MVIANGSPILNSDINLTFSDTAAAPTPSGVGIVFGLDEQKNRPNGYGIMRFRLQEQIGIVDENSITYRFTCPDDFDIYVAGVTARIDPPSTAASTVTWTAQIQGAITDVENDLPIVEVLFLTEPVSSVVGQKYVRAQLENAVGNQSIVNSERYGAYDYNGPSAGSLTNRPINTLLKNVLYEVIIKRDGIYTAPENVTCAEFYIQYKPKLRRN